MRRKWLLALPIILVMLALCAAMIGIVFVSATSLGLNEIPFLSFGLARAKAEAEEQKVFDSALPSTLIVYDPCGDVSITADAQGEQVSVTALKRAWGRNTEQAQENLAKIELSMTQDGDTVRLALAKSMDNRCVLRVNAPFNVDYTVHVPEQMVVRVDTEAGNILLVGTQGKAQLTSQFGDVNARQVSGELEMNSQNGVLTARDIQAGKAPIRLKTAFGDVHLDTAEASALTVESNNGSVEVTGAEVSGAVELTSDFGDVTWKGGSGQSLSAESKNGEVSLQDLVLEQGLTLTSNFGNILVANVQAESYTASTKNGKVSLDGVAGVVTARSDFGDITINGEGDLRLDLDSKNGGIEVSGSLADGQHNLKTRFGDVRLRLPEQAAFNFDLQTNFGKISSVFPVTIQGAPNETHWQGMVNGGGPALTASTENGNIVIEYNQ